MNDLAYLKRRALEEEQLATAATNGRAAAAHDMMAAAYLREIANLMEREKPRALSSD